MGDDAPTPAVRDTRRDRLNWVVSCRSVRCPDWRVRKLLDHLIGPDEQQLWHSQAERLGGLQIDDQLERCRLLEWQLGGVFAFQNPIDVISGFVLRGGEVWSIRQQAAQGVELPEGGHRREAF